MVLNDRMKVVERKQKILGAVRVNEITLWCSGSEQLIYEHGRSSGGRKGRPLFIPRKEMLLHEGKQDSWTMKGRRMIHELNESGSHLWHPTPQEEGWLSWFTRRKACVSASTLRCVSKACGAPQGLWKDFCTHARVDQNFVFFQNPPSGSQLSGPCAYFPLEG